MNADHFLMRSFVELKKFCVLVVAACLLVHDGRGSDSHWVVTWGCAPQLTEPNNLPPVPLAHSTLRQFVRNSIPGKQVRVRFSNAFGASPVTIHAAHIALAPKSASGRDGSILLATDRALTFQGATLT